MLFAGLDLGQRQDHTALAIVERRGGAVERFDHEAWRRVREDERGVLVVRYLERIKLGTPYVEVVRRVMEVMRCPAVAGAAGRKLVVDATGVGAPLIEMLREELRGCEAGCEVMPVTITGGAAEHYEGRAWHVPKVDLLGGLQELLEREELTIAKRLAEAGTLVRELVSVQARVRSSGRLRVGADGVGEHDDLVIAVGLACWAGRKGRTGMEGGIGCGGSKPRPR